MKWLTHFPPSRSLRLFSFRKVIRIMLNLGRISELPSTGACAASPAPAPDALISEHFIGRSINVEAVGSDSRRSQWGSSISIRSYLQEISAPSYRSDLFRLSRAYASDCSVSYGGSIGHFAVKGAIQFLQSRSTRPSLSRKHRQLPPILHGPTK